MRDQLCEAKAIVKVDASLIAQALQFTAKDDIRYYLNGICIRPSDVGQGVQVLASDGHVAAVLFDELGRADREVILPIPANVRTKLLRGGHLLHDAAGFTWITDEDHAVLWVSPAPAIDYKSFPNVIEVAGSLAEYDTGLIGTFNPNLLDKISKCQPKRKYPQSRFWTRRTKDGHGVALVLLPAGFALIMPMRGDDENKPLDVRVPAALQAPPKQAEAAAASEAEPA